MSTHNPTPPKDYAAMSAAYALSALAALMMVNPEWVYEFVLGVVA